MSAEKKPGSSGSRAGSRSGSRQGSRPGTPSNTPRRGLIESSRDDPEYWKRTDQVTRVQRLFKPYGSAVASYVLAQSLTRGGVARIVLKLGLTPRNMEDADLTQAYLWLQRNGAEEFCRIVGIRLVGESTEVRKLDEDELGTQIVNNSNETQVLNQPQSGTQIIQNTEATMIQPGGEDEGAESRAPKSGARVSSSSRNRSGASDMGTKSSDSSSGGSNPVRKVGLKPVGLDGKQAEEDRTDTQTGIRPVKLGKGGSKTPPPSQSDADPLRPKQIPRDLHRPKAPPPPRGTQRRITQPVDNTSATDYLRKILDEENS